MLLGHLAAPVILRHYYAEVDTPLLMAGSVAPDVVDKFLQQVGAAPSGRSAAHTLLALAVSTVLVRVGRGRTAAMSWSAGYLGHLICDSGGTVPWLFPFAAYQFERTERRLWVKLLAARPGPVEILLLGWAIAILLRRQTGNLW